MPVEDKDWTLLAGMGSGAEEGLADAGIDSYEQAEAACAILAVEIAASGATPLGDGVGASPSATYEVDDLVCFLCLSKNKEAVPRRVFPPPAPQVSIAQDLGLVAPVAAPGARVPSGETLCHARVRSKTAAKPAIVSIAARVLQDILRWVSAPAAGAMSNCCRAWHAGGLFLACAVSERRRGVADSVASILSFDAKPARALLDAGATKTDVLRAWACAWDLLDGLPHRACLSFDERLLSMALARMGVKEHLRGDAKDAAARMFLDAGGAHSLAKGPSLAAVEKETLAAIECHVVMMMAPNDSGFWR